MTTDTAKESILNTVVTDTNNIDYQCNHLDDPYKLLAENMVDCVWLYNCQLKQIVYTSPSVEQLLGYSQEEANSLTPEDILTAESLESCHNSFIIRHQKFLSGDVTNTVIKSLTEVKCKHKLGHLVDVELSTKYLYRHSNDDICVLAVGRDISERVSLLESLSKEIEEKNAAIRLLETKEEELKQLTELLIEKNETLKVLAGTDDLTCLYNRYYLDKRIMSEIERAERYNQPLSLILFDLDHFKNVNDTWGHAAGDAVLVAIADQVTHLIRYPDILARWGGEEFAILLPQTGLKGAGLVAEKVRLHLEAFHHPGIGQVTSSFGVATLKHSERWESWFKRVDLALYQAKAEGRNKVVINDEFLDTPLSYVKVDWNPVWSCGNDLIDAQHKNLLLFVNELLEKHLSIHPQPLDLNDIDTLIGHLAKHFEDEEKLQSQWQFPDTQLHTESHKRLIDRIEDFKGDLSSKEIDASDFFTFVMDEVVMGHLLTEDIRYYPFVAEQVSHLTVK